MYNCKRYKIQDAGYGIRDRASRIPHPVSRIAYPISRIPYLLACLLCFIFTTSHLQAQEDSTHVITEAPADDDHSAIKTESAEKYFLETWEYRDSLQSPVVRHLPDSLVKRMRQDDDFWYANADIQKKKPKDKNDSYTPLWQREWFKTLIWLIIIAGFAGFIMWYLSGEQVGLFRKKSRAKPADGPEEETMPEDIFAINYQKEIDKAVAQGNYRLAVRLHFLRLLKEMSEKDIISYKQDRTNFDYLLQLHNTGYYTSFFRITRNYEYSWYGHFDVSADAYAVIRNDFDHFTNQMR